MNYNVNRTDEYWVIALVNNSIKSVDDDNYPTFFAGFDAEKWWIWDRLDSKRIRQWSTKKECEKYISELVLSPKSDIPKPIKIKHTVNWERISDEEKISENIPTSRYKIMDI